MGFGQPGGEDEVIPITTFRQEQTEFFRSEVRLTSDLAKAIDRLLGLPRRRIVFIYRQDVIVNSPDIPVPPLEPGERLFVELRDPPEPSLNIRPAYTRKEEASRHLMVMWDHPRSVYGRELRFDVHILEANDVIEQPSAEGARWTPATYRDDSGSFLEIRRIVGVEPGRHYVVRVRYTTTLVVGQWHLSSAFTTRSIGGASARPVAPTPTATPARPNKRRRVSSVPDAQPLMSSSNTVPREPSEDELPPLDPGPYDFDLEQALDAAASPPQREATTSPLPAASRTVQQQSQFSSARSPSPSPSPATALVTAPTEDTQGTWPPKCGICAEQTRDVAFRCRFGDNGVDTGHVFSCSKCAPKFLDRRSACPACRATLDRETDVQPIVWQQQRCDWCNEGTAEVVNRPCGHVVHCLECSEAFPKFCRACNAPIESRLQVVCP
eukprot:TRINITY_DN4758_c0_g1_i2.p1 TRINITY_DN4758_c0_g1~~TRINITY_DN4758_c0_g1_i2.p1  ORF type:complete len:438 (+),score=56.96 TRINITY_DN4758_c0_g1_i2:95-1408(+)